MSSVIRDRSLAAPITHAPVVSLTLAFAATILLVRLLPIQFLFLPNDLGIVSHTILIQYPKHQDTFWYAFSLVTGALVSIGFSLLLRGRAWTARSGLLLEMIGVAALLAVLVLPQHIAEASFVACLAMTGTLAFFVGKTANDQKLQPTSELPATTHMGWVLLGTFALLGMLLTPGSLASLWKFLIKAPDSSFITGYFGFLAETGQHIAWTDRLMNGQLQGRDYFCLYGPFYDLGLAAIWKIFGRSVASYPFYLTASKALGLTAAFLVAAMLLRRPALAILLPFLAGTTTLRIGLGLFGIVCLVAWLRSGRRSWCLALGLINGTSLLYSQEFGLASILVTAVAFAVKWDRRAAALFLLGLGIPVVPTLGYYAWHGALYPMLRDLLAYPSYVMAGFGAVPFPALNHHLPLTREFFESIGGPSGQSTLQLRTSYIVPGIFLAGLLLALPLYHLDPRHPIASVRLMGRELSRDPKRLGLFLAALYGILCFRSALGRSGLEKNVVLMPIAAAFLMVAMEHTLSMWRGGIKLLPLAAWRTVGILVLAFVGGFFTPTLPIKTAQENISKLVTLIPDSQRREAPKENPLVAWIQDHSAPSDPVMFVPADAAYYYLTKRFNPTRFDLSHQMITHAHRAEALADMQTNPPRWIVWDTAGVRVDGIGDDLVFGTDALDWIVKNYKVEKRIGSFVITGKR